MSEGISHIPTNETIRTEATITVRVIKSFEYRTERNLVLHKLNLEATTVGGLKEIVHQAIQTGPAWRPYRNAVLETRYTQALYKGTWGKGVEVLDLQWKAACSSPTPCLYQTTNLIINLDHEEWILEDDDKILADVGLENETEVSFFNREAYENFKLNPEIRWDITVS